MKKIYFSKGAAFERKDGAKKDILEAWLPDQCEGCDPAVTKVYRAKLTGTNNADPTAAVRVNTLGGTVVWARTGEGVYTGTLTGAFTAGKTTIHVQLAASAMPAYSIFAIDTSANVVTILTDNAGSSDFIGDIFVTITVDV